MISFFKKCNIENNSLYFSLKYNLEINKKLCINFDYDDYCRTLSFRNHRLTEILENCEIFHISGENLKDLPNNIFNPKLSLKVWFILDGEFLPENWEIKELKFVAPHCTPIIPNSFKNKSIIFNGSKF